MTSIFYELTRLLVSMQESKKADVSRYHSGNKMPVPFLQPSPSLNHSFGTSPSLSLEERERRRQPFFTNTVFFQILQPSSYHDYEWQDRWVASETLLRIGTSQQALKDNGQPHLLVGMDCNGWNTFCFYCQRWVLAIIPELQKKILLCILSSLP